MYNTLKRVWGNKIIRSAVFVVVGAIIGFLYYRFIGCQNSCALTSSPWTSMIAGGVIGYLITDSFKNNEDRGNPSGR